MTDPSTTPEDLQQTYDQAMQQAGWTADVPAEPTIVAETPEPKAPPSPLRIIEALLFVGGAPLTCQRAQEIIRGLSAEQFTEALDELNRAFRRQNRPYRIETHHEGCVLTLMPRFRHVMDKVYGGVREARLSTAAIDVLALVAYRQPVTKSEVDSLRGAESGPLLRQLVRRGLIQVVNHADRKEVAYGTTPRFLEIFDLQSLEDLPKTQELN
jgi:segregation and condensation protein B